tara:strand:- start:212 stop:706 length:495 start_codon:yes stop_codon:yes gene_type:complete
MSGIINSAGSRSGVIGITELDYEEGTWTPTVYGSTTGSSLLWTSTSYARYNRVGNRVFFNANIVSTDASPGGASIHGLLRVGGLPFPAPSTTGYGIGFHVGPISGAGVNLPVSSGVSAVVVANLAASASVLTFLYWTAATGTTSMNMSEVLPASNIAISGSYIV